MKEVSVRAVIPELAIYGCNEKPYESKEERMPNENAKRQPQQHWGKFISTP